MSVGIPFIWVKCELWYESNVFSIIGSSVSYGMRVMCLVSLGQV